MELEVKCPQKDDGEELIEGSDDDYRKTDSSPPGGWMGDIRCRGLKKFLMEAGDTKECRKFIERESVCDVLE